MFTWLFECQLPDLVQALIFGIIFFLLLLLFELGPQKIFFTICNFIKEYSENKKNR